MVRALWSPLSRATRSGLVLAALGVLADFVHHVFSPDVRVAHVLPIELAGHGLTLVGMVVALGGVVGAARHSRRRVRKEGGTDAARCSAAAPR